MKEKKLSAYVDESGQNTQGAFFVVSVVVLEKEELRLSEILELIEQTSGKKNMKWNKAKRAFREKYIEELLKIDFEKIIFFETFSDTKEYIDFTSLTTAKSILSKANGEEYKASIFVDGLKKKESEDFRRGLRQLYIRTKKIRGVKKDENNVFIRLADALCGLVNDVFTGEETAKIFLEKLMKKRIAVSLDKNKNPRL